MKAYKEGKPIPEISDAEAKKLYDQRRKDDGFPDLPLDDPTVEDEVDSDTSDASTSDDESPEPVKARSPPRSSKRSKKDKELPVKPTRSKPSENVASPVVQRGSKSPENERKKQARKNAKISENVLETKKEAVEIASSPILANQDNSQKKKTKGRKRKSEAIQA